MKAICKIDNKQVKCEIIDNNYNDNAKEVKILEGIHTGKFTIVENYDVVSIEIPKTITTLVKLVNNSIEDKEDLENNLFTELVSYDVMETVEEFSRGVQLSKKGFNILTGIYGVYNSCNTIEEVKLFLIIDLISLKLEGNKITYRSFKKQQIDKSL